MVTSRNDCVINRVFILANIITFLIFWRRNCMLSRSSTFYLMAMSVADTGVLVCFVVLELVVKFHSAAPFWARQPWCSLRDLFTYGSYNASTWLVVTFTAERFLAINTWSLKSRLCTPRCALWAISSIYVLSHLLAVPHLWANVSEYDRQLGRWTCVYNAQAPILFIHSLVGFQTLLSYILPFPIIITLNGLTLHHISVCNRIWPAQEPPVSSATAAKPGLRVAPILRSRRRKSVVLLVTVSMTFLMLSVVRAVTQIILRTSSPELKRQDYGLPLNVAADLGTMLCLSNAAVNMYLYAATQTKFRQEVIACAKQGLAVTKSSLTPSTIVTARPQ